MLVDLADNANICKAISNPKNSTKILISLNSVVIQLWVCKYVDHLAIICYRFYSFFRFCFLFLSVYLSAMEQQFPM